MLKQVVHIFLLFLWILFIESCKSEKKEHLTICFTGDVLLDRGVRKQIEKKGVDYLFKEVIPIFRSSDAVIINLECPITDTISPINKQFIFRADSEWTPYLLKNGITHAALANNHTMDQGRRGLESTSRHLKEAGIIPIGYGVNQSKACEPIFIYKNGIEVAVFNSVLVPIENWMYLEEQPGVCQATIDTLVSEIQILKSRKPDCYVFVTLHWGIEYQQNPTIKQRREAYRLIEAGVDAVIGHHPHVIQKEEYYKGKPIFYSLGNFIFDQTKPGTTEGLLLQVVFEKEKIHFKKHIHPSPLI